MIVAREDEIKNFQKEKYYTVELLCNGMTLSTERIDRPDEAESILDGVGEDVQVSDVIQKKKRRSRISPLTLRLFRGSAINISGTARRKRSTTRKVCTRKNSSLIQGRTADT